MNTYPESLFDRNTYLERENDKLKRALNDLCAEKDQYIHNLRCELQKLSVFINRKNENSNLWVFQGDGYDAIRSLGNSTPVLITAHELRGLIENGEITAPDVSAPIMPKANDWLNRLIKHVAVLNLAIDGDDDFKNFANEYWASLPDDLIVLIEKSESDLLDDNQKQQLEEDAGNAN